VTGGRELKFGAKDFDSLAQHVQGMIDDLQDGIGMGNSKDGSFGDEALADKVDLFEKHWHQQAKPNLIDHLGKLKKHIETSRHEFQEHERKLAAEAKAQAGHGGGGSHHPATTTTTTTPNDPPKKPHKHEPTEAELAQKWYAFTHGYTDQPPGYTKAEWAQLWYAYNNGFTDTPPRIPGYNA
jgi:hypothetical protein